jgi:chromosome partitioning protein
LYRLLFAAEIMRTIAIANQKGGCGKTTTAVNLAAAMAEMGRKILLIDMDMQAHTTLGVGIDPETVVKSTYDVMSDPVTGPTEAILHTKMAGLDIMPSNILLSGLDVEMAHKPGREFVLKRKVEMLRDQYEFCIIDCAPSLSLLTLNALSLSDYVIVPVQTQYYALEGLKQLLETLDIVRNRFNPHLSILGVLLTFYEGRTLLSRDVEQQMRDYFREKVFKTVIHRTVRLAEAPSAGESVITYDPASKGAEQYRALAREVCDVETQRRTTEKSVLHI